MKILKFSESNAGDKSTSIIDIVKDVFIDMIDDNSVGISDYYNGVVDIDIDFEIVEMSKLPISEYIQYFKKHTDILLDIEVCIDRLKILIPDLIVITRGYSPSSNCYRFYLGSDRLHGHVINRML